MYDESQYKPFRFFLVVILFLQILLVIFPRNFGMIHAQAKPNLQDVNVKLVGTNQTALYYKSQRGLMDEAYGIGQNRSQSTFTSGSSLGVATVYESGSWPETVAQGDWLTSSGGEAMLATSFDFDPANDNRLHLYTQTGTGTLTRTQQVATSSVPMAMAKGDLNHDGLDDVAVVNQADDTLGVFLQLPGGGLSSMVTYATGTSPDGLALGDFNSDTRLDVAVSHAVDQTIAIYYQQADGTLSAPTMIGISSGGFNELEAGDVNGDGYDDLVMLRGAGHTSLHLAVFYQQDYALLPPIFRTAQDGGFLAHGLAVGDVTDDGRADIVVTAGGNTPNAFVNIFVQQPDGSLATSSIVYPAFHLPEAVEVGDVNHDGRNDVILSHAAWMSLSVYAQTVTNTLSAYEAYPLPYTDYYRPDGLALGDVNSDGGLDVLLASHSDIAAENGLVVLTNTGIAPISTITTPSTSIFITNTNTFLFEGTASASAVTLEISTDGGQTWQSQSASVNWSYNWNVPGVDGRYPILVRTIDAAGRVQSPPAQTFVIIDRTAPTGLLLINNDAVLTNILTTTLTISTPDADADNMRFANDGVSYSNWTDLSPNYTWLLTGGDGLKTVTGQVQDWAGNISEPFTDTIILDTTAPSGGCDIDDDNGYVNIPDVTLSLWFSDTNGVDAMQIRNVGDDWGSWISYTNSISWTLPTGDGQQTVECRFRDAAQNVSIAYSGSIILDMTPPICQMEINNDLPYTSDVLVTLNLSNSSDNYGLVDMRFSNDGGSWSSWTPYATSHGWTLPSGNGSKTVWAEMRDVAENSSQCTDTVVLDTIAPTGEIVLAGGVDYTPEITVTVTLTATDSSSGVSEMCLDADGPPCVTWQPYITTTTWLLDDMDGVAQEVCAWFHDGIGNESEATCDSIILDTTPPAGSVVINDGDVFANDSAVTLTVTAVDSLSSLSQMRFSQDSNQWDSWQPYDITATYTLVGNDGLQTVYIQFQDMAGNVSDTSSDDIILDRAIPSGSILINDGAEETYDHQVTLNLSAQDSTSGVCDMRIRNQGESWEAWQPFTTTIAWQLTSGTDLHIVEIQYHDCALNESAIVSDAIFVKAIVFLPLVVKP